ncbi:MAG: hypothetical protein BGP12_14550 [Rhodospirillales bacterium 70-18]|nr:MAG: hypothetical protein BGP12_14550 [Rhodospirillales bacterium 70-18]
MSAAMPDIAALLQRGLTAHRAGRDGDAAACYARVLARRPAQADALYLLALVRLGQLGQRAEALAEATGLLRRAVAAQPGFALAQFRLGDALAAAGQAPGAIAAYRAALAADPALADAQFALGQQLVGRRDHAGAAACFRAVLAARPGDAPALNNLAIALQAQGDIPAAIDTYRAALARTPEAADIHTNLGCALLAADAWDEAIACHRRALALRPDYVTALVNLGSAVAAFDPAEAIASYRRAIALHPDYADAHYSLALALLLDGRYAEGWAEMEWWGRTSHGIAERRLESAPAWDGTEGDGTLVVYTQQGLGDTLQFARFVALTARRRPVVLEAPRALVRLLQTLPGVTRVVPRGDDLPGFEAACSLLGLPHRLGVTLEALPSPVPYLRADPAAAAAWQARLAALPGLKVGLTWAGNPALGGRGATDQADRRRSLALAQLAPLAGVAGVCFVSLQKGPPGRQPPPPGLALHDWTAELHDFADTAALMAGLDLVVSVDTSVAHLAGALGRPVWLLNRFDTDWRWLHGREDSPWYPTLRQFRQPAPGDWATPVAALATALAARAAEGDAVALYNQAVTAAAAGRREAAIGLYRRAAARDPGLAEAHNNLGNLLGSGEAALAAYDAALAARPDYAEAWANRGIALKAMDRLESAEAALRRAVALRPGLAAAHNALGTTLTARGRLEAALDSLAIAARLDPADPFVAVNQGLVLARLHRAREAIACQRRAVALNPALADAHLGLAETLLLDGQYREGWREYEWRWRTAAGARLRRAFTQPRWDRAAPPGGTVLLHAEQGLGDTLQFCRFAPLVARQARVVLEAPPPLRRLLGTLAGVAEVVEAGAKLPPFDRECPLLSLPHALGLRLGGIPAGVPYLHPDPAAAAAWRARLAALPGRKVGLAWAGNAALADIRANPIDRRRSLPLAALAGLGAVPGVSFVSLQKGRAGAEPPPPGLALHDWTAELDDFADTAALVAGLDLVVSVDTAVAHLAGALGRPVWLLNRFDSEWRWLLGRSDSPWYPTLRQFRQPSYGDWPGAIAALATALRGLAA